MTEYQLYGEGLSCGNLLEQNSPTEKEATISSIALRNNSFKTKLKDPLIGGNEDEVLPLSMIHSGGEFKPYVLYFFKGSESKWFFREKKFVFTELFDQMVTPAKDSWSREMKQVVLNHNYGPLFEMMDGRLYYFDNYRHELLFPFFIQNSANVRVIGSGIMSNVIMVQTMDGKIYKKNFNNNPKEIIINDPSPVKLFSCFSGNLLQIIVLENDKFFIIKDQTLEFGFSDYPSDIPVEIKTPFKSGIKTISSGYGHCVILLENGQIFTRGSNSYGQCAIDGTTCRTVNVFSEVKCITEPVVDIQCGSICTSFQTSKNFIFYGSVRSHFLKTGYKHAIEFEDQKLSFGPWHVFIYRNKFNYNWKSLTNFLNNLKSISRNSFPLNDVLISFTQI